MARHLILLVAADDQRLQTWHYHVRDAGHLALPASTITQATLWVRKVRPALILADVEVSDGRAVRLLGEIRASAKLDHIQVVIVGVLHDDEHAHVQRDPHTHVRHLDDDAAIREVLDEFLNAA